MSYFLVINNMQCANFKRSIRHSWPMHHRLATPALPDSISTIPTASPPPFVAISPIQNLVFKKILSSQMVSYICWLNMTEKLKGYRGNWTRCITTTNRNYLTALEQAFARKTTLKNEKTHFDKFCQIFKILFLVDRHLVFFKYDAIMLNMVVETNAHRVISRVVCRLSKKKKAIFSRFQQFFCLLSCNLTMKPSENNHQ